MARNTLNVRCVGLRRQTYHSRRTHLSRKRIHSIWWRSRIDLEEAEAALLAIAAALALLLPLLLLLLLPLLLAATGLAAGAAALGRSTTGHLY